MPADTDKTEVASTPPGTSPPSTPEHSRMPRDPTSGMELAFLRALGIGPRSGQGSGQDQKPNKTKGLNRHG